MYLSVRIKTICKSQIYLNTWPECQAKFHHIKDPHYRRNPVSVSSTPFKAGEIIIKIRLIRPDMTKIIVDRDV